MLSPLDVDRDLATIAPICVQQRSMPVCPEVDRGVSRVVTHPYDLLVGWDSERDPRPVDIVLPQQVVGDHAPRGVKHGNDPL